MQELNLSTGQTVITIVIFIILLTILFRKRTIIEIDVPDDVEEKNDPAYLSRYGRVVQM
ncbi:hypothetical protein [Streptococcus agalactiae]|uniref:hypothetical protein n=1 Tax=Streptococcus agalactiae TaxID=1311 RepID=UPI00164BF369|nr:hypothetical protein [Streptococcus agalactiae]